MCELTANTGSGGCAQHSAQTGYGTTYTYDGGGKLIAVAQAAAQTRTYAYDGLGRLTSETNPESGTSTYVYDSNSTCGTSTGDLVKKTDAAGIVTCVAYDALHRVTSSSYSNSTNCKFFLYDTNPGVGWTEGNIKGRLSNAWIGNCSTGAPTTNDEAFNYSARGELTNIYQLSTTNGIWYNSAATYWPNGAVNTLQLFTCGTGCTGVGNQTAVTPVMTYKVDGEGRTNQVYASSGLNPVTNTTYNSASEPTAVTYGTADSDAFTYDPNTFRMTNYQFSVNTQTYTGTLTWNANGSLGSLSITDPFNSADTQNCSYSHDDLSRIASVNCGVATWQQNFTYGPFGNIVKTVPVGSTGSSFQATYSNTTNHITNISGFVPTYDGVGNVTNDGLHTYSWDARGNSTNIDGLLVTFDALDRVVERNWQGAYTQVVYAPTGQKFAILSGLSLQKAFFPLPGQGTAVYGSSGLSYLRHADWLGSSRMASTPSRTIYTSNAYAPFGETYAHSGNSDPSEASFTGQNSDSTVGDYDFMAREYSNQGRWASPDPAGLAAADLSNPQSWNRYAYVQNNPMQYIDPLGLACDDVNASEGQPCDSAGGVWGAGGESGFGSSGAWRMGILACGVDPFCLQRGGTGPFGSPVANGFSWGDATYTTGGNYQIQQPVNTLALNCDGSLSNYSCFWANWSLQYVINGNRGYVGASLFDPDDIYVRMLGQQTVRLAEGPINVLSVAAIAEGFAMGGVAALTSGVAKGAFESSMAAMTNATQAINNAGVSVGWDSIYQFSSAVVSSQRVPRATPAGITGYAVGEFIRKLVN